MKIARRVTAFALAAGLGLGAFGVAKADAAGYDYSGVRIRNAKSATATVLGLGYTNQTATVYATPLSGGAHTNCAGFADIYWTYHRNNSTGVTGYSSETCLWY